LEQALGDAGNELRARARIERIALGEDLLADFALVNR